MPLRVADCATIQIYTNQGRTAVPWYVSRERGEEGRPTREIYCSPECRKNARAPQRRRLARAIYSSQL